MTNPFTRANLLAVIAHLKDNSLSYVIASLIGSLLGIVGAFLFSLVLRNALPDGQPRSRQSD